MAMPSSGLIIGGTLLAGFVFLVVGVQCERARQHAQERIEALTPRKIERRFAHPMFDFECYAMQQQTGVMGVYYSVEGVLTYKGRSPTETKTFIMFDLVNPQGVKVGELLEVIDYDLQPGQRVAFEATTTLEKPSATNYLAPRLLPD